MAFLHTGLNYVTALVDSMDAMAELRATRGKDEEALKRAVVASAEWEKILEEEKQGYAVNQGLFRWLYKARKLETHLGPPSPELFAETEGSAKKK